MSSNRASRQPSRSKRGNALSVVPIVLLLGGAAGLGYTADDLPLDLPFAVLKEMLPKPGCNIKGNISYNTGEHIYHVPGQQYYYQTVISRDKGERWFCSEDEARKAGWRKSKV